MTFSYEWLLSFSCKLVSCGFFTVEHQWIIWKSVVMASFMDMAIKTGKGQLMLYTSL